MSSFSHRKITNDLLHAVDKDWDHVFQENELVLVFKSGERRGTYTLPQIIQVTPEAQPVTSSFQSHFQQRPCTYLDCSGLRILPPNHHNPNILNAEEYASLLLLSRHLTKVQFTKILLVVPYEFLVNGTKDSICTLLTSPVLTLLHNLRGSDLKLSFGLIVVKYVGKEKSSPSSTGRPSQDVIREQRSAFRNHLIALKGAAVDDLEPSELEKYRYFLAVLINSQNFLILEQKWYWNGTIEQLVKLPSPPGYKILKFHQQSRERGRGIRVCLDFEGKQLWRVFKENGGSPHFHQISSQVIKSLNLKIDQTAGDVMKKIIKQYLMELKTLPQQEDYAVKMVNRVCEALAVCTSNSENGDLTTADTHSRKLTSLARELMYPLETEITEQLKRYEHQMSLLLEFSSELEIDFDSQPRSQKSFAIFCQRLKTEVFPKLGEDLRRERGEICTLLQSAYTILTTCLSEFFYEQYLPEHLVSSALRLKGMDDLGKGEEFLEKLEWETSPSSQLNLYQQFCRETGHDLEDIFGNVEEITVLEARHKSVDDAMERAGIEYVSCRNHSASRISKGFRDQVEEMKGVLISCNGLVCGIQEELTEFVTSILTSFEKDVLFKGLSSQTVQDKLDNIILPIFTKLNNSEGESQSVTEELQAISASFQQGPVSPTTVKTVTDLLCELENCLDQSQQSKMKTKIFQECSSPLSHVKERLTLLRTGFVALTVLKDRLETYEYQALIRYQVPQFNRFRLLLMVFPGPEYEICVLKFLHETEPLGQLSRDIIEYSNFQKIGVIEQFQLTSSNRILLVVGHYVHLQDVIQSVEYQAVDYNEIRIFASKVVFIDENIEGVSQIQNELKLSIIAPVIEVVGCHRRITLNGRNGEDPVTPSAGNGRFLGHAGHKGLPGKPGGNGGHFYLLCDKIKNSALLEVNCGGGNGGGGQNGGDGHRGRNGENAPPEGVVDRRSGQPGHPGGDGGDGGRGGHPGFGGTAEVEVLSGEVGDDVVISKEKGEWGWAGLGGAGGEGGQDGSDYVMETGFFWTRSGKFVPSTNHAATGSRGMDGANFEGQEFPRQLTSLNVENVISEYRKFIVRLKDHNATTAKAFLKKLDEKQELSHFSLESLSNDLRNLERTLENDSEVDSVMQKYQEFQDRLVHYSDLIKDTTHDNDQTKLVLHSLHVYSTTKILVLREQLNASQNHGAQVVNIQGYFDVIIDAISRLRGSHVELNRDKALKSYQDHIDTKCQDTERFISKTVLPAISEAQKEIQNQLEKCVEEIEGYYGLVQEDIRRRCEDEAILERIQNFERVQKVLFAASACINGAASIFPGFKMAGLVLQGIGGFSSILMGCTPSPPPPRAPVTLPECLRTDFQRDFVSKLKEKVETMTKQLIKVTNFLKMYEQLEVAIRPGINKWAVSLQKLHEMISSLNFYCRDTEARIGDVLADLEDCRDGTWLALEDLLKNDSAMSPQMIIEVNHLLASLTLLSCSPNGKSKVVIGNQMVLPMQDGRLHNIIKRQDSIHHQIAPLVNFVIEKTVVTDKSMNPKIKKWKVQSTLRDLKETITSFVKGLKTEKAMASCFRKVEEAMSLLIDLYDMMDAYEESKMLVGTLEILSSQNVGVTNAIQDPSVKRTLLRIEFHLKANNFRRDYAEAVTAFNQWIFPFANKYFPGMSPPSWELKLMRDNEGESSEERLKKVAIQYAAKFEDLRDHLRRYRTMTMDFDSVAFTGNFSNATKTSPPFFVWKWKDWGEEINKLLEGEEIELRADVWIASNLDNGRRGAVKFKSLELMLKHNKGFISKEQKELTKILKENYTISMIHSGISYYRVFSQCFVMRGSKQEFCYSFDGSTRNVTREKSSSSGDYLLSPYTVWSFKLNDVKGGRKDALKKFRGEVSLELQGDGWYVDEGAAKEKGLEESYLRNLHNHYELVQ